MAALQSGLALWSALANINFALAVSAATANFIFYENSSGSAYENGPIFTTTVGSNFTERANHQRVVVVFGERFRWQHSPLFLYDNTLAAASGYFTVNGVVKPAGATFAVTAAQLAQTAFHAGTISDTLVVMHGSVSPIAERKNFMSMSPLP